MPGALTEELECSLCGRAKSIHEFSRNARRLEDPCCKRCTAWEETQEPDVVPAPLETGHVSPEEHQGGQWREQVNTAEGFAPGDDQMPLAPVTDGEDHVELQNMIENVRSRDLNGTESEVSSRLRTLPPHIRGGVSAAPSCASSEAGDSSSVASTGPSMHRSLPPYFRNRQVRPSRPPSEAPSMTTATTVRMAREEQAIPFNAFAPDGTMHRRTRIPSTAPSTTTDSTQEMAPVIPPPHRSRGFNGARPLAPPRPTHQIDVNPGPLIGGTRYRDPGADWQTRLGFPEDD